MKYTYVNGRMVVDTSAPSNGNGRAKDTTTWFVIDGALRKSILSLATEDGIAVDSLKPTEKGRIINTYVEAWVFEGMARAKTLRTAPAEGDEVPAAPAEGDEVPA